MKTFFILFSILFLFSSTFADIKEKISIEKTACKMMLKTPKDTLAIKACTKALEKGPKVAAKAVEKAGKAIKESVSHSVREADRFVRECNSRPIECHRFLRSAFGGF